MSREASHGVKSVGVWLRVSTEDQVKGESLEHHEERARQYAKLKGWQIAEVYRLDAVSGRSVMGHPEAQRMLSDIRAGMITGLVFSKLARLARNTRELLEFAEVFRACDADMISIAESIDTSSPAGRLFFTMIAAMAQWEREEIAERVRASVPIRAKLGKRVGGHPPLGYTWKGHTLEVDPKEAPIRVLIYELFAKHRRRKTVARLLNERGYRTRRGVKFTDSTVTRLIQDPTAKGLRRSNHTRSADNHKRCEPKPESEWVWTAVEPIVSEALWEECNALVARQQAGRGPRVARTTPHLFAGFAVCSCGDKMYVPSNQLKYVCRTCRNKIPIDDLDAIYHDELARFLVSPEEVAAHQLAADDVLRERTQLLDAVEAELKRVEAEEAELFRLHRVGQIATGDFGRYHRPLSERHKQLSTELPRLQAEVAVLKIKNLSSAEVVSEARNLWGRWSDMDFNERRSIVETITDRIVIGTDEVEVSLHDLPRNRGNMATQPLRLTPP